jgi:pyruvate/2-oxoglutarate dehydrogenase complex dihydrolipoamide acyltransferase (E2) component
MRSTLISLSKRITIPQLSPTHTSARIIRFLTKPQSNVETYDPVMILECSSDLIADKADRKYDDEKLFMFIETCDEGVITNLNDHGGQWLDVGTDIGIIQEEEEDDEEDDGEWIWQAYLHEEK